MSYKNEKLLEFNKFLNGRKVAIIGLGVSNLPLLKYMYGKNANVVVFDEKDEKKDFIKWVDFNVSNEALRLTAKLDIKSHNENQEIKYNWIELLAYLACQNGGNFKNFKKTDLDTLVNKIKNGESIENLTQNLKLYNYYFESYSAVLSNFIGNYSIKDASGNFVEKYGEEETEAKST